MKIGMGRVEESLGVQKTLPQTLSHPNIPIQFDRALFLETNKSRFPN